MSCTQSLTAGLNANTETEGQMSTISVSVAVRFYVINTGSSECFNSCKKACHGKRKTELDLQCLDHESALITKQEAAQNTKQNQCQTSSGETTILTRSRLIRGEIPPSLPPTHSYFLVSTPLLPPGKTEQGGLNTDHLVLRFRVSVVGNLSAYRPQLRGGVVLVCRGACRT